MLTNLGEKLSKEEAKSLMKELCEPEDDDGFMPFIPFLEKMCAAEKEKASFVLLQVTTKTPHFEHLYIWWSLGNTEKQESRGNIAPKLRGKLYEETKSIFSKISQICHLCHYWSQYCRTLKFS